MERARPHSAGNVASDDQPEGTRPEPAAQRGLGEGTKRRAYLVVLTVSTLALLTTALRDGLETPYWGVVYPALGIYNLALLPAIWLRRLSLHAVEALLLVPVSIALMGFLAAWRLAPGLVDGEPAEIVLVALWTAIVFPLCFLVLGTHRGLWASLAVYTAFVVLTAPLILGGQASDQTAAWPTEILRSVAFLFPMLIALIRVLASRLEELTAARAQAAVAAHQAHTDTLTDLPNRRHLDDELERHRSLAQRHDQPLSVVLVDLDHFKSVNDQLGHDIGDRVLVAIASRLATSVRSGDLVGRWGGEEFLLIAPHTDHPAALELAERCRAQVAGQPFETAGQLTASLGVATLAPGDDARGLIRRADLALYAAKTNGRNRVAAMPDLAPPSDPRWASQPSPNPGIE